MKSQKAKVIRDISAEINPFIKSQVGAIVEVLAFLDKGTRVYVSSELGAEDRETGVDAILVHAPYSRTVHPAVDIVIESGFTAVVDGVTYRGNDIYSHEELQLL